MDDLGALFRLYAVVVVQNQSSRTLAAWDTGLEAVGLYHPERHGHVEAGYGTRGSALVKHKAPLRWTADSCIRQRRRENKEGLKTLSTLRLQGRPVGICRCQQ